MAIYKEFGMVPDSFLLNSIVVLGLYIFFIKGFDDFGDKGMSYYILIWKEYRTNTFYVFK